MKITILGTRGEIEEKTQHHKLHSGVVLEDPILIDVGESEYLDFVEKEIARRPEIFLTHMHPDHLFPLKTKDWSRLKQTKVPIYAPEVPKELENKVVKLKKNQSVAFIRTRVTAIPTIHSKKVKSTAYLVEKDGLKVLVTGDLIWINKRWHDLIENCDVVITDGSSFDKPIIRRDEKTGEIYGHNSVVNLVGLFKKLGAKKIVITHLGKWFMDNPEEGRKKIESLGAICGFDGMTLELSPVRMERPFVTFSKKYLSLKEMHQLEALHMDDDAHRFVMQLHARGKSVHIDHRWVRRKGGYILDGMTVAAQRPNITKKPITTLAQLRELAENPKNWKISNEPGALRMYAEQKAPEPYEWLTYEGVVEPGTVGATKTEYGVFLIFDKGIQYYGCQLPYFKEFFLEGRRFQGRFIYRMIQRRKPPGTTESFLYLFGKPISQLPYVLSKRAVQENWIPPWNVSCLPPEVRSQIKADFRFWVFKDASKRIEVRNRLVKALKNKEVTLTYGGVKLEAEVSDYVLQWKYFKKRKLIREGPSAQEWYIRILDKPDSALTFTLAENPLETNVSASFLSRTGKEWMTKEGYIAPGQPGNPSKDTPAYLIKLTSGKAVIIEESAGFYKIRFLSGLLKGLWVAKREQPEGLWVFSRSELPKPVKQSS